MGHKLEHRNKECHLQNSFPLKLEGIELWYLVFSISLLTSTKFVHNMMLVGSKLASPWGHKLEHRNKENQLQNSSSPKLEGLELWYLVFIISLWTFINCIHMIPLGSKKTNFKILLLWNWKRKSLDFRYVASPCRPLSILFTWCPLGSKLAPPQGSQVRTKGTKM